MILPVHQPCLVLIDASLYGTRHFVTMVLADVDPLRNGNHAVGCARICVCSMVNRCVCVKENRKNLREQKSFYSFIKLGVYKLYGLFLFSLNAYCQPPNSESWNWNIIREHY
jgi:hypothetical protein